jgi:hypothetical protein
MCLAEIDKLKKSQAAKPVGKPLEEIPRPKQITKLQHDMGLDDDKRVYSDCRVSFCLSPLGVELILITGNRSRCPDTWRFTAH